MFPDERWTIFSITEDDFIEQERCAEQLRMIGLDPEENHSMILNCHICPLSGHCHVTRVNAFLGAKTC